MRSFLCSLCLLSLGCPPQDGPTDDDDDTGSGAVVLDATLTPGANQVVPVGSSVTFEYTPEVTPDDRAEYRFQWGLTVSDPTGALAPFEATDWSGPAFSGSGPGYAEYVGSDLESALRTFRCVAEGEVSISATLREAELGESDSGVCAPEVPFAPGPDGEGCQHIEAELYHQIECTPFTPERTVQEPAVLIANTALLTNSQTAWGVDSGGGGIQGTFNMILRSPGDRRSVSKYFSPVPGLPECESFEGVPADGWTSARGVDSLSVDTRTQSATVDWSDDRYVWSGLVDGYAWEVVNFGQDVVGLSWDDDGPVSVEIDPPGIINGFWNVNDVLSTPDGYDTEFTSVSPRANVITIYATTANSGTTENGFTCVFDVEEGNDSTVLVPMELRDFVGTHGGIGDLHVGEFTEEWVTGLFPEGPVPVHVGSSARIPGARINP